MPIATKLTALLLLAGLAPLGTVTWVHNRISVHRQTKQIQAHLDALADSRAGDINSYFDARMKDASILSHNPIMPDTISKLDSAFRTGGATSPAYAAADAAIRRYLRYHAETAGYRDMFLISASGTVIFSVRHEKDFATNLLTGPYRDTELARVFGAASSLLEVAISDFRYYEPGKEEAAFVAAPVLREGEALGVLAVQVDTAAIYERAGVLTGLGRTGEILIASKLHDHAVVLNPLRHDPGAAFRRRVAIGSDIARPLQEAVQGRPGGGTFLDYRGVQVVAAWRYLPHLRIGMVLKQDTSEAFAGLRELHIRSAGVALGACAVLVLVALWLSRALARPVRKLTQAANNMAGGDLTVRTAVRTRDELGVLSTAFNDMAGNLQAQTEHLRRLSAELEIIMDSIPGLVFYKDAENRLLRVNKFFADAHKTTKDKLEGTNCFDLYPRDQAQAYLDDDLEVIRSGTPKLNIDEPWETETGKHWISTSKIPFIDEDGTARGVIAVSMDVTERRKAENEIREKSERLERENRLRKGQNRLNERMHGDKSVPELAEAVVTCLADHVGAQVGALFVSDENRLKLAGRFAYRAHHDMPVSFAVGEGLVGQAAAEKKTMCLDDVPDDYLLVGSALGQTAPRYILAMPFLFDDRVGGVLELASLTPFAAEHREFLDRVALGIGISIQTAQARDRVTGLLAQTQRQSEQLQSQQEELRSTNEELEEQTQMLKQSEERLKTQQEELQVTNEELKEKTESLQRQKREVEQANAELEESRQAIEEKVEELAQANRYKSEFLANMSHELRTPLNSLLILAGSLLENKGGNLTDDQVESARVIHSSGNALLSLINDILDLSKVEAGQMDLQLERLSIQRLAESIRSNFKHVFGEKGLALNISVDDTAPASITSDGRRLEQVIRNLVSNAVKFTEQGGVTVSFSRPAAATRFSVAGLDSRNAIAIAVSDTGIGIPAQKQKVIFQAFQQADGGTSRKYGGTGLGLSICRELVRLLGGEIRLESEEGTGSTFTVYLPVESKGPAAPAPASAREPSVPSDAKPAVPACIADDRAAIEQGDATVLIIEDDPTFAKVLMGQCREKAFKCLAAVTGEEGLRLVDEYRPNAIVLDINLPGMNGWSVLNQLKEKVQTRHIPVHIMSVQEPTHDALSRGAVGFLRKPATRETMDEALGRIRDVLSRKMKSLLVVEDDAKLRGAIVKLVGNGDVRTEEAATGAAAIEKLQSKRYDCMILDLHLPDMSGFELLDKADAAEETALPPVVVYTGRELTREEDLALRRYSDSIIVKGVRSEERLVDEVSLFLHRMVQNMPKRQRQMISDLHDVDSMFEGKKVLIVDDDMRNLFALSNALSAKGIRTIKAEDGSKALEALEAEPDVDLVLVDIMMPVMDGYKTMRRIRAQARFGRLPIIAVTAKAMKQDRQKCIEAGASDYIPKPVDVNRLFSMMRIWMYR